MRRDVWELGCALVFALRLSRVLGAAPLRLQARGATWHAQVCNAHARWSIAFVTLLDILVIAGFILDIVRYGGNRERMVRGMTNVDFIMWSLDLTVTLGYATFAVYSGRSRMTSLIYHFNQLKKATSCMHSNSEKKQKREKKRIVICILLSTLQVAMVICSLTYTVKLALDLKKEVLVACSLAAYSLCYLIGAVVGTQLLFLVYEIHAAMETLNEELEWIIFNIHETRPFIKIEEDSVRRIAVLYDTVSDIVHYFNKDGGGLMLMKFAAFNMYLIFNFFHFYDNLLESVATGKTISFSLVIQALWCLVHVMGMAFFVEPCHQTLQEVDKFRVLLTDLMYRSQPPGAPSSLCVDVLYKQLKLDTFSFTPLGVCSLTRSLFITAISTFTTVFVIVVQYRLGNIAENGK